MQPTLTQVDIPYKLNPTIEVIGQEYRWLMNRQNQEVLQRADIDETLHLVGHLLYQQEPKLLTEWVKILCADVDVEEADLEVYLLDLVAVGFLVSAPPCSWVSPMCDEPFMRWLFTDPKSAEVQAIRKLWRDDKNEQSDTPISMKMRMETAKNILNDWAQSRFQNWSLALPERIFFHDVTIETQPTKFTEADLKNLTETLNEVLEISAMCEKSNQDTRLKRCFDTSFSEQAVVGFMDFYETWYSFEWHQKVDQTTIDEIPFSISSDALTTDGVLNVSLKTLKDCFVTSPLLPTDNYPKEALMQPFLQDDKKYVVINAVNHGFGRLKGRHYHMFDHEITEAQREWNQSFETDENWMAELTDASDFHGNVRPMLLGWELVTTGSLTRHWPMSHLPISDLQIRCEAGICRLWNPFLKKYITPFNLDTEALPNRSAMFQLLALFAPKSPSLRPLIKVLREHVGQEIRQGITTWPRVAIETNVIIMRRAWCIEPENFPKGSIENQITAWVELCRFLKTPDRLYFCMISTEKKMGPKSSKEKPQYIDLQAPITVELLVRKCALHPLDTVWIEEMLPMPSQLETDFASEWVVEFR